MAHNLNIKAALYRDFKNYLENPGGTLQAISDIKKLYGKYEGSQLLGTFVGVPFTTPAMTSQRAGNASSGLYKTTVNIVTRTHVNHDQNGDQLEDQETAILELMNRANIRETFNALTIDQTYYSIMEGDPQPDNQGLIRGTQFSYTITHKISKGV